MDQAKPGFRIGVIAHLMTEEIQRDIQKARTGGGEGPRSQRNCLQPEEDEKAKSEDFMICLVNGLAFHHKGITPHPTNIINVEPFHSAGVASSDVDHGALISCHLGGGGRLRD